MNSAVSESGSSMEFEDYGQEEYENEFPESPGIKRLKKLQEITNDKMSIAEKKLAKD